MRKFTMLAAIAALLSTMVTLSAGLALAAEPQLTGLQQTTATTTAEATAEEEETATATTEATTAATSAATATAAATSAATAAATTAATSAATAAATVAPTSAAATPTTTRPGQLPTTAGESNAAATIILIAVALSVLGAGLLLRRNNGR